MPEQSGLSGFINELRRRKVFRVLVLYAGAAFVILQVLDGILEVLTFPDWVGKLVVAGLLLGFPLAAILGWIFDITSHGIVRTANHEETTGGLEISRETNRAPVAGDASIAVLPFINMSSDAEQDYFCAGMAEDIIDTLTKVPHLAVVSRTSTMAFKGKTEDIRDIGKQLGVGTVLEGSVRKSGDLLRITAQLIDVSNGYHLWSGRYDRQVKDVFAIQDEIARNIVSSMEGVLSDDEFDAISRPATDNVEAYDFYLRGREFFYQHSTKSFDYAIDMFEQAINFDPNYARAYAGLADCHSMRYIYFYGTKEDLTTAEKVSRKALELDSDLAEAHVSYGLAVSLNGQYELAENEFEIAIGMNQKLFEAYYFYARMCMAQGKMERAAHLLEKAAEVNPQDFQAPSFLVGVYDNLDQKSRMESTRRRAIAIIEKHVELNPDAGRALSLGAGLLAGVGKLERGLEFAERAIAADPDNLTITYNIACYYARAGKPEKALDYLSKVLLAGFASKEWAENDGDLTSLHGHPRFQELIAQMPSSG